MAMASCSQDETIGINHDGDEITFNVVTNNATRAADVYCNQNLPGGFYVSAISDGKTYIDKDHVTGSNGNWTNTSGTLERKLDQHQRHPLLAGNSGRLLRTREWR